LATGEIVKRYNAAWNAHGLDAILALHGPGMVFENHTAGERAEGDAVGPHIASILQAWPDLRFETRRLRCGDDFAVCEWTATATHWRPLQRGHLTAPPTGREISWRGVDVFTLAQDRIVRKDVYSDSVRILSEAGLLSAQVRLG
jgi:steroid delta-isomerase-like uncharacterized protein